MAVRFIQSYDHFNTQADFLKEWTDTFNSSYDFNTSTKRTGVQSLRITNQNTSVRKVFGAALDTWIVGTAFQFSSMATTNRIISFESGSTVHFCIQISASNTLQAYRGPASTSLGLGTATLSGGVWYYLEVKGFISDTVGTIECRLNGSTVPDILLTDQDTRNGALASADGIRFGGGGSGGPTVYFDDTYISDTTGGAPQNSFLGDCKVECLLPSANGTTSALDGSDGNQTDNYLLVDEANQDGDTTYVESGDIGDKDTYNYPSLANTVGTVYAVQLAGQMRKTDAGARSVKQVVRVSGTEEDSPADIALADSFTTYPEIRTTKPGGGAFTISDVNGMEAGMKVTT